MIVNSKDGARGTLTDLATGRVIRWARWADLSTGEYEAFSEDPAAAQRRGVHPAALLYRGRTKLGWTPAATLDAPRPPREHRCIVVPGRMCDHPGCRKLAEYRTCDERMLEPEDANGRKFERAVCVAVHKWCSWHYRPPMIVHPDNSSDPVDVEVQP